MTTPIYTAPPNSGTAVLGKTLPQLLYEGCARYPNPRALNQPVGDNTWDPTSLDAFRQQAETAALGLRALDLDRGATVALYMESDVPFCVADMGCLIAGLIDVPIYLTHGAEAVQYVMDHAEVEAVVVSSPAHLDEIRSVLPELTSLRHVIVAGSEAAARGDLPERLQLHTLAAIQQTGAERLRANREALTGLLDAIDPQDLATIIYTSGTTGKPKGVMLTHENISYNALTSFSGLLDYQHGEERALSFLPLTHVFARSLHYGMLATGSSVYFTTPERLGDDLKKIRPTVFATVPRLLEKVYGRILERVTTMTGIKKRLLSWALDLAGEYELGRKPTGAYAAQLKLADRLVFSKWREALGGEVKYVICGGAALNAKLANLFAAAGVNVMQGYGLTETSPVITYNRPHMNRAGTVGVPMPEVEVRIAHDGEILTRGPHIMKGYYKNPEKTAEVLTEDGWFHTGDIGSFTSEGYLRITDRKKDLFKLSTGKYVMPQPLENALTTEPLVEQAVVVGSGYKFCTALVFPEQDNLRTFARAHGLDAEQPIASLLKEPRVLQRYQELVNQANAGMDPWSTIKRFRLVPDHLTIDNGMLTPTMKVKRSKVRERFDDIIEAMYDEGAAVREAAPAA